MHWPRFAVLVLIATFLQARWINTIAVTDLRVTPDLLLIAMVFFAVRCNESEAIISSVVLGFAADIAASGFSMGPLIISFGLFGTAWRICTASLPVEERSKAVHVAITWAQDVWPGCWLASQGNRQDRAASAHLGNMMACWAVLGHVLAFELADAYKNPARGR